MIRRSMTRFEHSDGKIVFANFWCDHCLRVVESVEKVQDAVLMRDYYVVRCHGKAEHVSRRAAMISSPGMMYKVFQTRQSSTQGV